MKVRQGEPMVDPCVDCGRTGVRYGSKGMCDTYAKRAWRAANPEAARAQVRRWKDRHREANRARDRAYKQAVYDGERLVRSGETRFATGPRCVECREEMIERSPSGLCGFCDLGQTVRAAA